MEGERVLEAEPKVYAESKGGWGAGWLGRPDMLILPDPLRIMADFCWSEMVPVGLGMLTETENA